MATSKIEWTEASWNPLSGCSKVSLGCKNCYAERMAKRLQLMGSPNYQNGFKLTMHPHMLGIPFTWKKPTTVFVNSMSDLFHEDVPFSFIQQVFDVMNSAQQHTFQVLTKRSTRLKELAPQLSWSTNIWMGVTVEADAYTYRIDNLKTTDASVKFISFEPLLSKIPAIDFSGINWVIVGGESGPKARPMEEKWVTDIRDQCIAQKIPFFFKQWGGTNKKKTGKLLQGRTWAQMPI
jgi:protein gp37